MKNAKIFLVHGKRNLTPMIETAYEHEDDLQALLADYPDLLPGDQIDPENPRRWLLVARELGVPGNDDDQEDGVWIIYSWIKTVPQHLWNVSVLPIPEDAGK